MRYPDATTEAVKAKELCRVDLSKWNQNRHGSDDRERVLGEGCGARDNLRSQTDFLPRVVQDSIDLGPHPYPFRLTTSKRLARGPYMRSGQRPRATARKSGESSRGLHLWPSSQLHVCAP